MLGDQYHEFRYSSPPISPKSLPHGFKRKASTQEDESDSNSVINHSFKKLRLNNAQRSTVNEIAPIGISLRDATPSECSLGPLSRSGTRNNSLNADGRHYDDYDMPVDETPNRIWVNDLDAEIAEIEAEEARQKDAIHFVEASKDHLKIPEHLLKQGMNVGQTSPAANMQMVLYKDPISISVPETEDAVRKTIMEARRRMRQRQAKELEKDKQPAGAIEMDAMTDMLPITHEQELEYCEEEDNMDLD